MEQPKWQRARMLVDKQADAPTYPAPRSLVWVRSKPPEPTRVIGADSFTVWDEPNVMLLSVQGPYGVSWAARPEWLELLPEFSFSDDPEAEVRQ